MATSVCNKDASTAGAVFISQAKHSRVVLQGVAIRAKDVSQTRRK